MYEGIRNAHEKSKRKELIGKRYFGGIYNGPEGNAKLWRMVSDYIYKNYDSDALKIVYINGEGAEWIKKGTDYIPNSWDNFHDHLPPL